MHAIRAVLFLRTGGPFAIFVEPSGAVAHLGERFNGIEEAGGSSPPSSTNIPFRYEFWVYLFFYFSPPTVCVYKSVYKFLVAFL